jgi:hypothetical protein
LDVFSLSTPRLRIRDVWNYCHCRSPECRQIRVI